MHLHLLLEYSTCYNLKLQTFQLQKGSITPHQTTHTTFNHLYPQPNQPYPLPMRITPHHLPMITPQHLRQHQLWTLCTVRHDQLQNLFSVQHDQLQNLCQWGSVPQHHHHRITALHLQCRENKSTESIQTFLENDSKEIKHRLFWKITAKSLNTDISRKW